MRSGTHLSYSQPGRTCLQVDRWADRLVADSLILWPHVRQLTLCLSLLFLSLSLNLSVLSCSSHSLRLSSFLFSSSSFCLSWIDFSQHVFLPCQWRCCCWWWWCCQIRASVYDTAAPPAGCQQRAQAHLFQSVHAKISSSSSSSSSWQLIPFSRLSVGQIKKPELNL